MRGIPFVLLSLSIATFAQDGRIEEVGKSPVEAQFAAGGRIRMDLCSSGIDIVGTDEPKLRISYSPERDNVKVRIRVFGDGADLKLTNCPHNNFRARIEVPRSSDLHVRMLAGELNLRDVTGDKDVVLHFGQLNMDVGKAEEYGHVQASVSSGELNAAAFHTEKGGLFRSFDRSGPGKYRLYAHVGAGEIDLR
jgi:hypothetical protein